MCNFPIFLDCICSKQIKKYMVAHYYISSIIALKINEQTLENAISQWNNTCLEKTVIFQIVHFLQFSLFKKNHKNLNQFEYLYWFLIHPCKRTKIDRISTEIFKYYIYCTSTAHESKTFLFKIYVFQPRLLMGEGKKC